LRIYLGWNAVTV